MFLFIFESIGTSELILIGAVALIVFGPRKLPQMAKTLGKAMADFKNTTNEFKSTWEREVSFEEKTPGTENTIKPQTKEIAAFNASKSTDNKSNLPEIKEIEASQFNLNSANIKQTETQTANQIQTKKQNWL